MRTLVIAVIVSLGVVGCGEGVDDVVDRAEDLQERAGETAELVRFCAAAFQLSDAVSSGDREQVLDAAEDVVASAPEEIADEAARAREGARRLDEGDREVLEDEEFQRSVRAIADYARDNCTPE